jgi:hypothetical protein
MARKALSVEKLKRRGTWTHFSRAKQLARILGEMPAALEFGRPPMPEGLHPRVSEAFVCICDQLDEGQVLAVSDGQLVLQLAEVILAKNDDASAEIEKIFRRRIRGAQ